MTQVESVKIDTKSHVTDANKDEQTSQNEKNSYLQHDRKE